MRAEEAVDAIEANLVATWAAFACLPQAEVVDRPELARLLTGEPFAVSNGIFRARLGGAGDSGSVDESIDGAIDEAIEPFRRRGLPFSWLVGPGSRPPDLGERLAARGLRFLGSWPGMAIDLDRLDDPPALPSGVTVERVASEAALGEWTEVFARGFSMPEGVGDFFRRAFVLLGLDESRPLQHFLARVDGEPAACSSVSLADGVAGIYNVATLPAARNRGLGSVVSTLPLHVGRASGSRLAILHATDMAVNVYRRLGFREHCRIGQYIWDPPAAGEGTE